MALELTQANTQIQHFLQLANSFPFDINPLTKVPEKGNIHSLCSQLKALRDYKKNNDLYLDAPTSGESSPCQSDSERDSRIQMPSILDVCELLTDELSLDLDESPDKYRDTNGKSITLVFENFDINFRASRFFGLLKDIRVNGYSSDRIFSHKESKNVVFRESTSIIVDFIIKRNDLIFEYFTKLETHLREQLGRPIKVSRVISNKQRRGQFYAIIVRNIPPKVTKKEIVTQCQREISGQITAGTLLKIKTKYCIMIRFETLDDAESVCRRLNNFSLRDPQTHEKYVLKAHIHPGSNSRNAKKEPLNIPEKSVTGINELRDMFMRSKKPSLPEKPKPPDVVRRNQSYESMNQSFGESDSLLKRFYSNQTQSSESMHIEKYENGDGNGNGKHSELSKLMQTTSMAETTTMEYSIKAQEYNPENRMEEETIRPNIPHDDNYRGFRKREIPLTIVKESTPKETTEKTNKRSSSQSPRYKTQSPKKYDKYDKDRYSKRNDYHNRNRNWDDKKHYIKRDKDRKRSTSKTKRSNSKSKSKSESASRSRSRSKSKDSARRYKNQYKNRKNKYEDDHKKRSRSRSKDGRKYKKSNSRSESKSKRNDKDKEKDQKRKKSDEVNKGKEGDHEKKRSISRSRSRSDSKRAKKRSSRSGSMDRKKFYDKNKNYHNRDYKNKFNDHHRNNYKRDYDSKYHNYHTDRRHHKSHRDYDDRKKKSDRDYEKDRRKNRRRSGSKSSRSSSKSRSRSPDHKKRRRSNDRNKYSSSKERSRQNNQKPEAEALDIKREGTNH